MARRGDGLVLRGKTWWLDFAHMGRRYQVRLGRNINRTTAAELATVERAKILKGEAGIGANKRKDILFNDAVKEFLKWAEANKRPGTAAFYDYCFRALAESFNGRMLGEIHPFLIEKRKQMRLAKGFRAAVNREVAALSVLFNRMIDWGRFEGLNPTRKVKRVDEPLNRLRFLSSEEEQALLKECDEPLRTIVLLGIYAGLRITAEALTLKKENIDLGRRLLTIEAAYSKNRDTQTIPLHSKLVEPLRARMEATQAEFLFPRGEGTPIRSVRVM